MKIVFYLRVQDLDIVSRLVLKGVNSKIIKTGVVVELPLVCTDIVDTFKIIDERKLGGRLFIKCAEIGGAMSNIGFSEICCGLSGVKLRPYYIVRNCIKNDIANGIQCYFSIPTAVVTINSDKNGVVDISRRIIIEKKDFALIRKEIIWIGRSVFLPTSLNIYKEAVKASVAKAKCLSCKHVHFSR